MDHEKMAGDRHSEYDKNSLSLVGSIAMGTGVMIGAGIFALTGQVAELTGDLYPLAFVAAAIVVAFSAYSYVKASNAYPSAGGIAMILKKAYGKSTITAGCALLMYFSMVINESLVARTFGAYTVRIFGGEHSAWVVPALGVGLIVVAFVVNLLGNKVIGGLSKATALVKILGVAAFALAGLWASGLSTDALLPGADSTSQGWGGFLAAVGLAILAYKGFTTITNSGAEIEDPHKNVGRSIVISLIICTLLYLLVTLAVASSLDLEEVVAARDSSLAEAARPTLGQWGEWLTIGLAVVATFSGIIASMFAASRMLAMLTEMRLVPHNHFGMPGRIQKHTLAYTAAIALTFTVLFDLGRIASIGAIYYIVMDIAIHWGLLKHLRKDVNVNAGVVVTAIVLDAAALGAFILSKARSDSLVIVIALGSMALIFAGEWFFLRRARDTADA